MKRKNDNPVPQKGREQEAQLDQASEDSFPASDPMPFSPTTSGAPDRRESGQGPKTSRTPQRRSQATDE